MTAPRWIDVQAPAVELKALTWGPPDGPIALCLYGFPDTAYGWRKLAPRLAQVGWRVVAPFMRGYALSSIPSDGSYHMGALMDDALQVRLAAGGTDRDVVIGHDWRPPMRYAQLHRRWTSAPTLPSWYLHGRDDGCMTAAFADWTPRALPDGSDVTVVEHARHFLQLDEPEKVAELVLKFIGSADEA